MSNVMSVISSSIGKTVDFTTFSQASANTYRSVKITAILDHNAAISLGLDAPAEHAKIYPTLPPGSVDDYRKYAYVRIQHTNGSFECIGIPWIVEASLVIKQSSRITVVFENVGPADVEKIREMSVLNGYSPVITIE